MKKHLLAALLSFSLVFFPSSNSNAIIPVGVVVLGYTANGATLTAGVETVVMGALALIGITAGFFTMTAADGSKVVIPMVPGAGGAVPAPSAPATTPVISQPSGYTYNGYPTPEYAAQMRAKQCANASWLHCWPRNITETGYDLYWRNASTSQTYPSGLSPWNDLQVDNGTSDYGFAASGTITKAALPPVSTCPTGYVLSVNICNLTDAKLVTQDKRQNVSRAGNVMSVTLGDLHGVLSANVLTTTNSNDTVSIAGTGTSGQPMQTNFVATPSGTTILQSQQMADSAGNTYVQTVTATVDLNGTVTSASQSSSNTSLQPDPNNSSLLVPVANPSGSISANPTATGGGFPNDYARAGEAAAAAATINAKLDTLHHDLSDTTTVVDPLAVDPTTMPSFGTTFDNLKAWNLPAHASTCPAPDIDLSSVFGAGHVYSFNAHCQLVQDHFAALQAAMMVCWSLMAMFVVLRA